MKNLQQHSRNSIKGKMKKVAEKLWNLRWQITLFMLSVCSVPPTTALAAGGADAKWQSVISFITPWIGRMGGLVILIGAVEFGLAFKSDDAEGKTRGIRTIVAGCIVFAVGASTSTFL
jgi:hypothetical protein